MKQLKMIIQILEQDATDYERLAKECFDEGKRYASEYTSGKAAGYRAAISYLNAYTTNELPWEEN